MAMTPLERKHRSLEKKAEREKLAGDPTDKIAERPFNEYLTASDWSEVLTYLDWAGINPDAVPTFDTDDDPEHNPETDGPYRGSIGRAERMVGLFLDAASQLASMINDYKKQEIGRAIAELEGADLTDPAVKRKALADIVRFNKLSDQLDKQVRWTLPQWKVKGG
jgi:hypothetical protein